MEAKTFRGACCERFQIPPEAFEEEVLWRCFHPRARMVARFLWRVDPDYFSADLRLIQALADCTTLREIRGELCDYRYHHPILGFWRKFLRVRVSGRRLMRLAMQVFD